MNNKTFTRKCFATLLAVLLIIYSGPNTALATVDSEKIATYELYNYDNSYQTFSSQVTSQAFVNYINKELKNCNTSIDISKYNLTLDDAEGIVCLLSYGLPECFHLDSRINFSQAGNKITILKPTYLYTKNQYDSMLAQVEQKSNKLLEGLTGTNLSDLEKALILHDRIALNCEYDYQNYLSGKVLAISHTMYGTLVNGVSVCQGYAHAYNYLLNKLGIKSESCPSETLCHVWNIIYIDNKPYHVDITFDDQVWDVSGRVSHTFFLSSTQYLKQNGNGHNANDFIDTPTDTTYDEPKVAFWKNVDTAFVLANNEIYYIDSLNKQVKRTTNNASVYNINAKWKAGAIRVWPGVYSKLASDGENLLISLNDGIYRINAYDGTIDEVYKPTLDEYVNIYGFALIDGYLVYETNLPLLGPNYDETTKALYQKKILYQKPLPDLDNPVYTPGDINADNLVNLNDIVVLAQCVADWDIAYNSYALDVNDDGLVNLSDVVFLAQYVAGWSGIILH